MKTLSGRLREMAKRLEHADEVNALREAVGLLERMEPAEPEKLTVLDYGSMESGLYLCGACQMPIGNGDKFCKHCGRKVKWDA